MIALTMTRQPNIISNVKEKFENWKNLPFKQKLLSIIKNKPAQYTIASVVAAGAAYGGAELLQNFQQNQDNKNNIVVVVDDDSKKIEITETDSNQVENTNIQPDTVVYVENNDNENNGQNLDLIPNSDFTDILDNIITKYQNSTSQTIKDFTTRLTEVSNTLKEDNPNNDAKVFEQQVISELITNINTLFSPNRANPTKEEITFYEEITTNLDPYIEENNKQNSSAFTAINLAKKGETSAAKLVIAANKIPLSSLQKNATFAANFNDAENLFDAKKSNEITAKKTLTEDDKTMLLMQEYYEFKNVPTLIKIESMRGFLFRYKNAAYYMDSNILDDASITSEYLKTMKQAEKDFKNTPRLKPDLKQQVAVDDL